MTQVTELQKTVEDLQARVAALESKLESKRDVGERKMTDEDARRLLGGDLAEKKHKEVAEELKLSYGQVYSARLGFTFKHIAKELKEKKVKSQWIK